MILLEQSVLTSRTITSPTWTDPITLPPGCRQVYLTLDVDADDLASSKTLNAQVYQSADGVTWEAVPGGCFDQPWQGPSSGPLMLGASCTGGDGSQLKTLLLPDAGGITLSAMAQVLDDQ
jgi:hypothetical protein